MYFLKCIAYLTGIGIASFFACRFLPKRWFHENAFPYKRRNFEKNGKIYEQLGIRSWQNRLSDMSRVFPRLIPVKSLQAGFPGNLPRMVQETCVAEFIHVLLCLAGFVCIALWPGPCGIIISILYCLGNIPFILIQRYNRIRLIRVMNKHLKRTRACDKK